MHNEMSSTEIAFSFLRIPIDRSLPTLPHPDDYSSSDDFFTACTDWESEVLRPLRQVRPNPKCSPDFAVNLNQLRRWGIWSSFVSSLTTVPQRAEVTNETKCGNLLESLFYDTFRSSGLSELPKKKKKSEFGFVRDFEDQKRTLIGKHEEWSVVSDDTEQQFAFWREVCHLSGVGATRFNYMPMSICGRFFHTASHRHSSQIRFHWCQQLIHMV